jgi:hypothetical protein
MSEDEYKYHRHRAIEVRPFGLCSRMRNGLIKIEGEWPMNEAQLINWVPQRFYHVLEKLRSLQ